MCSPIKITLISSAQKFDLGLGLPRECLHMGIMRVHLSLGDTVYVSDEQDHGVIEQFVPYGRLIVRLVKKGKVLKLNRGDVKKSRQ